MSCMSKRENGVTDAWKDQIETSVLTMGKGFALMWEMFPLKPPEAWTGMELFELAPALGSSQLPCWVFSVRPPGCAGLGVQGWAKFSRVSGVNQFAQLRIVVKEG